LYILQPFSGLVLLSLKGETSIIITILVAIAFLLWYQRAADAYWQQQQSMNVL
jgi:hypothetical protein